MHNVRLVYINCGHGSLCNDLQYGCPSNSSWKAEQKYGNMKARRPSFFNFNLNSLCHTVVTMLGDAVYYMLLEHLGNLLHLLLLVVMLLLLLE